MRDRFYFRNVTRRWEKEAKSADCGLLAFFPYITSNTAETVLFAAKDSSECEVYTDFSPLNFVNGSSSLSTMRGLFQRGVKLFHLPELHAKVLLVRGRFVSIGSQNLTTRGMNCLEATSCFDGSEELRHIESQVDLWIENRIPITLEMIDDMMELVPEAQQSYAKLSALLEDIATKLESKRLHREQEFQRAEEERKKELEATIERKRARALHEQRLAELRLASKRVKKTLYEITCTVRNIKQSNELNDTFSSTLSLAAPPDDDLLLWWFPESQSVSLERLKRFLCFNLSRGTIGWARVCKTRITFVHNGVSRTELRSLGRWRCRFSFTAHTPTDSDGDNLKVTIQDSQTGEKVNARGWFGLDQLALQLDASRKSEFSAWLYANADKVHSVVLAQLLTPFDYTRRLAGAEATSFFGEVGTSHDIRLALVHGHPVLVSEEFLSYWTRPQL